MVTTGSLSRLKSLWRVLTSWTVASSIIPKKGYLGKSFWNTNISITTTNNLWVKKSIKSQATNLRISYCLSMKNQESTPSLIQTLTRSLTLTTPSSLIQKTQSTSSKRMKKPFRNTLVKWKNKSNNKLRFKPRMLKTSWGRVYLSRNGKILMKFKTLGSQMIYKRCWT